MKIFDLLNKLTAIALRHGSDTDVKLVTQRFKAGNWSELKEIQIELEKDNYNKPRVLISKPEKRCCCTCRLECEFHKAMRLEAEHKEMYEYPSEESALENKSFNIDNTINYSSNHNNEVVKAKIVGIVIQGLPLTFSKDRRFRVRYEVIIDRDTKATVLEEQILGIVQ